MSTGRVSYKGITPSFLDSSLSHNEAFQSSPLLWLTLIGQWLAPEPSHWSAGLGGPGGRRRCYSILLRSGRASSHLGVLTVI